MPTQRFLNLPNEKRKKIEYTAIREFSEIPLFEVSINQIIKKADISHGSFYTYFRNKEDLVQYLLQDFQKKCRSWVLESMEINNGDIFQVTRNAMTELMDHGMKQLNFDFYKNILLNTKIFANLSLIGFEGLIYQDKNFHQFVSKCYCVLNKNECPVKSTSELACLMEMLLLLAFKSTALYFMGRAEKKDILNVLDCQLQILKQGVGAKIR
ncbi:TetR family transcriptional regulator [Lachnospiraceae bacterium 54-53]